MGLKRTGGLRGGVAFSALGLLSLGLACSSDSEDEDDGIANYYVSGRVLDGSTLEPLAGVALAVSVGEHKHEVRSEADGSFSVGPIVPDSDYRITASAAGFGDFAFYGSRLPSLPEAGRDRALVGDVALFRDGGASPAFTISASSRDARLTLDTSSAEVRFMPIRVAMDPATIPTVAAADEQPQATLNGVQNTWLPNHALSEVTAYRARIIEGQAAIPSGALRWGAGYNVEVYGGPAFEPANLEISAGRAVDTSVWLTPSQDVLETELSQTTAEYFSGRVYDGVSLARLTNYSIRLEYYDRVIPGAVDGNGRYFVGPLLPNADYSVVVEADGYRSFLSHNERIDDEAEAPLMSYYYDAFLYPENVSTPGATCRVRLTNATELPSGFARFAPTNGSSLFDTDSETPVGVDSAARGRQLWTNDEDLQQRSLVVPFHNGSFELASGQLVYGVSYAVTVYGVPGYRAFEGTYTAGVDGDQSWALQPLVDDALEITTVSPRPLELRPDGQLEFRFNQPIALDPRVSVPTLQRILNDSFSIDSPNVDGDAEQNVLVDAGALTPPVAPGYRGVSLAVDGERLVIRWNGAGLATSDPGDPVTSVTYGGLDSVMLYAADAANPQAIALSTLLESTSVTVQRVGE